MIKKTVLALMMILMAAPMAMAVESLQVEFSYAAEPEPDYFRLYLDGTQVCDSSSSAEPRVFQCEIEPRPYGVDSSFTITAVSGELEGSHSPPYSFAKDLGTPGIDRIININVNVNVTVN